VSNNIWHTISVNKLNIHMFIRHLPCNENKENSTMSTKQTLLSD